MYGAVHWLGSFMIQSQIRNHGMAHVLAIVVLPVFRAAAGIVVIFLLLIFLWLLGWLLLILLRAGILLEFTHTGLDFIYQAHVVVVTHHLGFHLGVLKHHGLPQRWDANPHGPDL